jgi:ubiquinone/menaquinone biosynthesis C-methylase UbiE
MRPRETYTPGLTDNAMAFMARRRAATHAGFFIPRLRPGDHVLDCGCGPGRITRDLARLVGPSGEVVGVDRSIDQAGAVFEAAGPAAAPVRFQVADVYALPFDDGRFDAVFAHALFEHLKTPDVAARELLRVLKPGGVIGLRSPDWGGFLLEPTGGASQAAIRRYEALLTANGGDIFAGRKLRRRLREAGAEQVTASASYEIYPDPALIADYLALQLDAVDPGAARALRAWGGEPEALFAQAWCEALGFKPGA